MTMTNAIQRPRPDWVPAAGHQLHRTGVHFDAIRIQGVRGEQVAARLIAAADGDAGPVVCEALGFRWMYFLLPPGTAKDHAWPLGVQRFGGAGCRTVTYIGIPALDGNTWPLRWYSEPTPTAPYVDPSRLRAALGCLTL
ncbi:hypothetical protein [Streptomyces himalayensis]|uniref:Uncharacterized protein n=1 Tax=Streptomyces himalayensis subsp. himalayensis TaxID=2756131 RepID=A0A7W0DHE1_9ACTN|nr:hypothetical protein [Streptomyces himalayensis]MBA2945136.1 hypothetical protein [Streptomyces himalayensis subsp. himalayensis]